MRELQLHLTRAGFTCDNDSDGDYESGTEAAVRAFQDSRGLTTDGICGAETWQAVLEAQHRLGDRYLLLRSPMLRGDDVSELQRRLGALGFDAGRVDGIFGPDTAAAVAGFQRNCGLTSDGISGPDTVAVLDRLAPRAGSSSVAVVRERERLRAETRALSDRHVVVGDLGGAAELAESLHRRIALVGADVRLLSGLPPSDQAQTSNEFDAEMYLGLRIQAGPVCRVAYFATEGFESAGGRKLAELLVEHWTEPLAGIGVEPTSLGMRLPILRETRMPAVFCELGPAPSVADTADQLSRAARDALQAWVEAPT